MNEPLDKNKSDLTHKITALAGAYLDSIGCKPIETEVPCGKFIVDIGSFAYPTYTELKKSKFLKQFCSDVSIQEWKKAELFKYRFGHLLTMCVEVKVTENDFKKDLGRKYDESWYGIFDVPVHCKYLAYPNKMKECCQKVHWGHIICSDNGERIIKIIPPHFISPLHSYEIIDFIAQVAIRRDHRTRYAIHRAFWKNYRANRKK